MQARRRWTCRCPAGRRPRRRAGWRRPPRRPGRQRRPAAAAPRCAPITLAGTRRSGDRTPSPIHSPRLSETTAGTIETARAERRERRRPGRPADQAATTSQPVQQAEVVAPGVGVAPGRGRARLLAAEQVHDLRARTGAPATARTLALLTPGGSSHSTGEVNSRTGPRPCPAGRRTRGDHEQPAEQLDPAGGQLALGQVAGVDEHDGAARGTSEPVAAANRPAGAGHRTGRVPAPSAARC